MLVKPPKTQLRQRRRQKQLSQPFPLFPKCLSHRQILDSSNFRPQNHFTGFDQRAWL